MKEILLHKQNANGKRQIWHAKIIGATYIITYGIEGGKFQTETKTVLKGKNIGKKKLFITRATSRISSCK